MAADTVKAEEGGSTALISPSGDTPIDDTPESTLVRSGSERGYFADDDLSSDRDHEEDKLIGNGNEHCEENEDSKRG